MSELVAGFVRALQPDFVVETGSAFGQTAEAIGLALIANGHGVAVSLETDPERHEIAAARCANLPVDIVLASSLEWTPPAPIDFMWLDSLPDLRAPELRRFHEHAPARAVAGVHDTHTHASIRDDLDALAAAGLIDPPMYLPTPRGVAFARLRGCGVAS